MTSREPDYYDILNLPAECSIEMVRDQYRRLAKIFHPDRNAGDPWCEEQLKRYNLAYQYLSDNNRKAAYDERRKTRDSDAPVFQEPFESVVKEQAEDEVQKPWSFEATEAQKRVDSQRIGPAPIQADVKLGSIFHAATVASPLQQPQVTSGAEKHSGVIRYSLGLFAVAVVVIILFVINTEPDSVPATTAFTPTESASVPPDDKTALDAGSPGGPISLPVLAASTAPISKADDEAADTQRHAEAAALKIRVTPYWSRYRRVRPRAVQAASLGEQALNEMQAQDINSPGGNPKAGTLRYEAEAKLWTDVKGMRDKLSAIDAEFDDLQYPATDDDVSAELTQLDSEIKSLERSSDPLFSDISVAKPAKTKTAELKTS